jgi:hypothetical protein
VTEKDLFSSDEESEPLVRKEKGKGKQGKTIFCLLVYING